LKNISFEKYLLQKSLQINAALKKVLPKDNSIISKTMRYAISAGGKRLRPFCVLEAASLFNVKNSVIMSAACALEYMHTYSLVHDDLPAMDNDDLRRGKPTVHKKFGEAAAILCGDALLTESFNLVAKTPVLHKYIVSAISILSEYSGYKGMIDGQAQDTLAAGNWNKQSKAILSKKLKDIQLKKTAALIAASLKIGAVLSGANQESLNALKQYAINIGCSFQIIDDILDVYADKKLLGKKGSDRDNNKLTALSLYGKDKAHKMALAHIDKAKSALKMFGQRAYIFHQLADYVIKRGY
jgi:geranylgeranyl diphosphate synthase type II